MVTRPVVVAVICVGIFLILQTLVPIAMALKRVSNIKDFMAEDQRTHKRKNYMVQRGRRELRILGRLNDPDRNPEELSAFNVDHANMITNDVILLDKFFETSTRKRGNIKFEKYTNQAIPDPSCSCRYSTETRDLGEDVYPRYVETRNCGKEQQRACIHPYICEGSSYDLKVLRKRTLRKTDSLDNDTASSLGNLPINLQNNWVAELIPISVGCVCKRDYLIYKEYA